MQCCACVYCSCVGMGIQTFDIQRLSAERRRTEQASKIVVLLLLTRLAEEREKAQGLHALHESYSFLPDYTPSGLCIVGACRHTVAHTTQPLSHRTKSTHAPPRHRLNPQPQEASSRASLGLRRKSATLTATSGDEDPPLVQAAGAGTMWSKHEVSKGFVVVHMDKAVDLTELVRPFSVRGGPAGWEIGEGGSGTLRESKQAWLDSKEG